MFSHLIRRIGLLCCVLLVAFELTAADTCILKVHFLYGSQPRKSYKDTEPVWFGGRKGGHVGLEMNENAILNFVPDGSFHLVTSHDNKNSRFALHDFESFYSILGGIAAENKKMIIHIPVSPAQKEKFDSLATAYMQEAPYDYAFVGMRCAAAAYDILSRLGIFRQYELPMMVKQVFYPKILRNALVRKAKANHWKIERVPGTGRRKWERD